MKEGDVKKVDLQYDLEKTTYLGGVVEPPFLDWAIRRTFNVIGCGV
ncbi:MAG: hypothetical protein V3R82_01455 [Candidatus Hydrothermarchaeales archaeon]